MAWSWLLLSACAVREAPGLRTPPPPVAQHFELALSGRFETRGEDGLAVDVPPLALSLQGTASLVEAVRYRDGSVGRVLTLHTLVDAATGEPHGLQGRALELRSHESGEVLVVSGWEGVAGAGRHGEVLDLMLPLFSPEVPDLGREDRVVIASSYPVRVADGRRHKVSLVTAWTPGEDRERGRQQALAFEGQLQCEGQEQGLALSCAGSHSGHLVGSREGGLVETHLEMTRTFVLQGPGGTLVQAQTLVATATRQPEGDAP